jgi:hypothetical protein
LDDDLKVDELDNGSGLEAAPCVGSFPKGEGEEATGIEKKLDDALEVDELNNGLETVDASSFSFCIFRYVDLYDSRTPDMSAKGSSSKPLEIKLRREWFNPRRLI